ncbi:hypothetical protein MKW92_014665, partial [Papaver armeniacum]
MALKRNAGYVAVLLLICILILVVGAQCSQAVKLEDNPSYKEHHKECADRCFQETKARMKESGYNPPGNHYDDFFRSDCEDYCKRSLEPMRKPLLL